MVIPPRSGFAIREAGWRMPPQPGSRDIALLTPGVFTASARG